MSTAPLPVILWSRPGLWEPGSARKKYQGTDLFLAGSLVEPTSVAYNAVIERGGGICRRQRRYLRRGLLG